MPEGSRQQVAKEKERGMGAALPGAMGARLWLARGASGDAEAYYALFVAKPVLAGRIWAADPHGGRRVMLSVQEEDKEVLRHMCEAGGIRLPEKACAIPVIAVLFPIDGPEE